MSTHQASEAQEEATSDPVMASQHSNFTGDREDREGGSEPAAASQHSKSPGDPGEPEGRSAASQHSKSTGDPGEPEGISETVVDSQDSKSTGDREGPEVGHAPEQAAVNPQEASTKPWEEAVVSVHVCNDLCPHSRNGQCDDGRSGRERVRLLAS